MVSNPPAPTPGASESAATPSPAMARALELARGVLGATSPNPAVGAVLVRDGRIVGEGATAPPSGAHAEVAAIRDAAGRDAGRAARDATLYVTLEPCSVHGRTPPCTDAIRAAGIAEVVVAFGDPDSRVDGSGITELREAGIPVRTGDGAMQAAQHYRAYTHHRRRARPFVIAKYAASLDGKIAATSGDARWVSGPEARAWSHRLRVQHDAILVGVETVLQDDPQLTARSRNDASGLPQPLRVVLDSRGRTPATARLLSDQDLARTVVACTAAAPADWRSAVEATGARVLELPAAEDGRVALPPLLDWLAAEGIVSLIVEGGSRVHGAFFDAHLVQQVHAVIAPLVIGGDAAGAVGGQGAARMSDAVRLRDVTVESLGRDLLVTGTPMPPPPGGAVSVRRATPADADALTALIEDSARRDILQSAIAAATDSTTGAAAWVAVSGGAVVGGVSAAFDTRPADGQGPAADARARLDHLLIAEPWRDHGLAARLLDSAEASAAGQGCRWAVAALRPETEAQGWRRSNWAARGYRYYRRGTLSPGPSGTESPADAATVLLIKEIATREQLSRRD